MGGYAPSVGLRDEVKEEGCVGIRHERSEGKVGDCSLETTEKMSELVMEAVPGEDWDGFAVVMVGPREGARCFERQLRRSAEGRRTKSRRRDGLYRMW